LKDELSIKILIKKPTKKIKKIRIKFDRKNKRGCKLMKKIKNNLKYNKYQLKKQ
jgi:hypothetical protein